jgi:alginate O-acetyltransferase complex protein AlgI
MLFNSIDFIIFFIIILTAIVIIKNNKFSHLVLLAASIFFFYYSSNILTVLLISSIFLDFYIARYIWKSKTKLQKKILLFISLAGNLGLLGFFKYADFAINQFNILGNHYSIGSDIPLLELAVPIGISFYTFQTISYTVDVYRGKLEPCKSLKEFALFVAFFPQLVAGPIIRASHFLPQLREKIKNFSDTTKPRKILLESSRLKFGITLMSLGLFKKMFFADHIAPFVDTIFDSPIGLESYKIILGAVAFGIQIYADFSGYADIAIGIAIILGFNIPKNFNKPYFATSPADFWRRWHISLSTWLRDYLYIPLGGNKKSSSRTYLNLLTVMVIGGLWHGASWNFVIWGILHGAYLAIHKIILDTFPSLKNHKFFKTKVGFLISIIITQYFVFLAWIPFRVHGLDNILYSMEKYIFFDFELSTALDFILLHKFALSFVFLFIILHFISYKKGNLVQTIADFKLRYWILFLTSIMLLIFFFYAGANHDFIYFKF